jgi:hypothetical protein
MKREDFDRIHEIICERYPHLRGIRFGNWKKAFAVEACSLEAVEGVTPLEYWDLAEISYGVQTVD